jgi:hypothetical protein
MGKIQSGVKPPQSKKTGFGISREDAKARRRRKKEVSVSREDAKTRRKGRKRGSSLTRRREGAEGWG